MNRTIKVLATLLAVLALLLAGAGWWASQSVAQEARRAESARPAAAVPTYPMVVLAKALPAGAPITADVLKVEALPVRLEGGFAKPDALLGRRAQQALPAGTPLLESQLVSGLALRVEPGERAVAVKVDEVIGIGHRIRPGDLVDVFVHFKREDREIAETASRLLLPRLRVLAYGGNSLDQPAEAASAPAGAVQRDGGPVAANTAQSNGRKDQPRNAVLAVPVDQVATLLLGEHSGHLALALRHPEDTGTPTLTPLVGARAALPAAAASSARADDRALAGVTLSSMNGASGRAPAAAAAARTAEPRREAQREPPRERAAAATVEVIRGSKQEQVPL